MSRVKYYLLSARTLLIFLPIIAAAGLFFDASDTAYNTVLLFLLISCAQNFFNKRIMIHNMIFVDITAAITAAALVFICCTLNIPLYTGAATKGVLFLICLNQLFMCSRNNYKERVSVRKGYY